MELGVRAIRTNYDGVGLPAVAETRGRRGAEGTRSRVELLRRWRREKTRVNALSGISRGPFPTDLYLGKSARYI